MSNLIVSNVWFHRDYTLLGNALGVSARLNAGSGLETVTVVVRCPLVLTDDVEIESVWSDSEFDINQLHLEGPIDLNGHDLLLRALSLDVIGSDHGNIYVSGAITGTGNVRAITQERTLIEFRGTQGNTFSGALTVQTANGTYVSFNKQSGSVVNDRLNLGNAAVVVYFNDDQIGDNATVSLVAGAEIMVHGHSDTIGSLIMTNFHADATATLVDTRVGSTEGSGVLTLRGGITSWVFNDTVLPTIRGVLNLPAGGHIFDIQTPGAYAGFDMQAQIVGIGGFSKYGNAALLLYASNTFSGGVSAAAGVIDVYNNKAFGATSSGVTLNDGSVTLRNLSIDGETLFVRGQQQITSETAGSLLTSFGVSAWTGAIELDTNLVVALGDMTLSGSISGPGGLALHSGGTVQIGGSFNNTYTGTTLARCPVLELNKPLGVNAYAGPLVVGGGPGGIAEVRWLNFYQNPNTPLTLYANGVVNLNGQVENFGPVTFNGGSIQTGTGFFVAESSTVVNPAVSIATVNGNLSLGISPANFIVGDGPADPDLRVNAIISGAGIIKRGPGTLSFTTANTFSGALSVQEGILHADNNAAFGATSGNTIVYSNATIRLGGVDGLTEAFQLDGTGQGGTNGALQITVGGTMTGNIFLIGPSTINSSGGSLAINSVISGTGPLTKTGAGNLFLGGVTGGTGNNTYSGDTIVSAGALYLSKNTGVIAVPGNLIVGPALGSTSVARFSRSGMMNASAVITVNANSLLDLNGNNQTLPRLNLNDGGDVQTGGGTLGFGAGGAVSVGTLNSSGLSLRLSSSISGNIALPVLDYLTFEVAPYGPAPFPGEGPELDVSAVIRNGGNIIKTGQGALRLSGANTFNDAPPNFAGDLFVNAGTVIGAHSSAFGGTAGWTFVNNGGALALVGGISINGENLHLSTDNSPALDNIAGDNVWNGPINLSRDSSIAVSRDWSLQINGVVSGGGGLTKIGQGVLTLGGDANNTHGGNTFVNDGTLLLAKSSSLQAVPNDLIIGAGPPAAPITLVRYVSHDPVWNRITVNANALLDLNGFNEISGDLTLNGGGDVQTGAGTYYLGNNAKLNVNPGAANNPATITGRLGLFPGQHLFVVGRGVTTAGQFDLNIPATVFQNSTTAGFIKDGLGRLRLGGTNTYAGTTYINNGIVQVDGVQPQSTVELDHETGLRGSGIVGHILFNGGLIEIAPGSSPGTLTCNNFDASGGNGKLIMELNSHPTGYDQINARGAVDLTGLTLQASLNFASAVGQQFTLINNDHLDLVTGTFTGLPQNAPLTIGNESFVISYTGGNGNDVVLTRVPTPPRPVLVIERAQPGSVRLQWPTNFPDYSLHFSTNLSASNWSSKTPAPVIVGTNYAVTNTTANSPRFFRLQK